MKTLSLWEPWASLMAYNLKKIETRHWSTNHRGPLAIHAAKRPMTRADWETLHLWINRGMVTGPMQSIYWEPAYGCLVAITNLHTIFDTAVAACEGAEGYQRKLLGDAVVSIPRAEYAFGNYEEGRFGWVCKDTCRLRTPIPLVGRQGLFDVDLDRNQLEFATA